MSFKDLSVLYIKKQKQNKKKTLLIACEYVLKNKEK